MKRVMLGTPTYDGNLSAFYVNSLIETLKIAENYEVEILPLFICYDALVQRARNDIVKAAIEAEVDNLVFIDADIMWGPEDFFKLLNHKLDVVGGVYPKKSDKPAFNMKVLSPNIEIKDDLMEVECVGTGMLCISSTALELLWANSEEYHNGDRTSRMVFDIQVVEGELVSEDNIFCHKWRALGRQVWIDPYVQCNHVGVKVYGHNFMHYLEASNVR